ncbi:protease Do-like 5, chloroplastic [Phalaenopsis equestris]|uniref:protease Do-like 5, chloroplastic n=1 Tax=Phalaenopsis equestris TaxID=78828 RepID=UPI0009E2EAA9|nr:protease Do-like 5, chloroplastic [Phalaenopsis equestris]
MLASFRFSASPQATATGIPKTSPVLCSISSSSPPTIKNFNFTLPTRRAALFLASSLTSSLLQFLAQSHFAKALEKDEPQEEEERVVRIFQESSPAVVYIKYLEVQEKAGKNKGNNINGSVEGEDEDLGDAKVEGTGSGFVWDEVGHIVTNYHVVAKLATDTTGRYRCGVGKNDYYLRFSFQVFLEGSNGRTFAKEGRLVGFDPSYDLAVLKIDIDRDKLRPAQIGTSQDLRVGQSCFAIGNPFGYEHTLTTGVVSGLRREIPSPNGGAIRGAIQTDAAINAGNSGGPLIDSYGHVIGVNTATFTRKGSGISSGVNFAIPIDAVVRIVPSLIINGTDIKNR